MLTDGRRPVEALVVLLVLPRLRRAHTIRDFEGSPGDIHSAPTIPAARSGPLDLDTSHVDARRRRLGPVHSPTPFADGCSVDEGNLTEPEYDRPPKVNRARFDAASFRVGRMSSCRRRSIPRCATERCAWCGSTGPSTRPRPPLSLLLPGRRASGTSRCAGGSRKPISTRATGRGYQ